MTANHLLSSLLGICLASASLSVHAAKMVVMESRGSALKIGESVESSVSLNLKEGERLTLIGPDGKTVTRRGPYSGPVLPPSTGTLDPKQALAVLIATRDARASSIGVIRAGTDTVKIPSPWLIDVTRSGPRCLLEGELPVLWRPESGQQQAFVIFPADRSWRADFVWKSKEDSLRMPPLARFKGVTNLLININQQEFAISFSVIPKTVDDPTVLTAWMLEKGCVQQADALLRMISSGRAVGNAPN